MLERNFAFSVVYSEYPHVGHMLKDNWGEPDFNNVMEDLLHPHPKRRGFPNSVFNALRTLALMHEMEMLSQDPEGSDNQLSLDLGHGPG